MAARVSTASGSRMRGLVGVIACTSVVVAAMSMLTVANAFAEAVSTQSPNLGAADAYAMVRAYDRAVEALITGNESEAESQYRDAIEHAERGQIRDARYALSCVELAMLRARNGDSTEAVSLMARAHVARSEMLGTDHPDVLETRLMLRELERQQDERAQRAEPVRISAR